jgi:hypothetical protein
LQLGFVDVGVEGDGLGVVGGFIAAFSNFPFCVIIGLEVEVDFPGVWGIGDGD